jgi:hypothetical protein
MTSKKQNKHPSLSAAHFAAILDRFVWVNRIEDDEAVKISEDIYEHDRGRKSATMQAETHALADLLMVSEAKSVPHAMAQLVIAAGEVDNLLSFVEDVWKSTDHKDPRWDEVLKMKKKACKVQTALWSAVEVLKREGMAESIEPIMNMYRWMESPFYQPSEITITTEP